MSVAAQFANIPGFRGDILLHGGRGYPEARQIFNMRADTVNPSVILKPKDEDDVALVMKLAARLKQPIGLRSGGHNVDGTSMIAPVVLDLRNLRDTHVDTEQGRITVGAGIMLGDLDALCQEYRLIVPTGTVGATGVVGLTLGGGIGFKMRQHGATVDNLLRCRVVTAQGEIVTASAEENPDLFWALRGAGANFGVVTELEFQAHPFNPVANVGRLVFPGDEYADVMLKLGTFMENAAREIGLVAALTRPPRSMGLSSRDPVLMFVVVTTGDPADFESYISTLASFGTAVAQEIEQMPWTQANTMLEAGAPTGLRAFTRGGYFGKPDVKTFDALYRRGLESPDPAGVNAFALALTYFGGAISEDFDEDAMAFSRENGTVLLEIISVWESRDLDREALAWVDQTIRAVQDDILPNGYINLTCDNNPEWVRQVYGKPAKYERLVAAKTKWDPDNLLRFNRNILPAPA